MKKALQRLVIQQDQQFPLPGGWVWKQIDDVAEKVGPGKLYDEKSSLTHGTVPIIDQSASGLHGFHNEDPGVNATPDCPTFTFANHTCAMRFMRSPYSSIQNVFSRRAKPEVADTRFLYYTCRDRITIDGYKGHHPIFRRMWLPIPQSKAIQTQIASILSAYDDLIENNRRRIQLLEESARLLYKEWFVHLRFPGHEHTTITDGVPEGWERQPLDQLCITVKEQVKPQELDPETPYIGLEHLPRRSVTLGTWGYASEATSTKYAFRAGDVLFAKIRPYFHKVGVALSDGITSSDGIVIRPVTAGLHAYLACLLSSDDFVALASQTMREGSKMPRADWKLLQSKEFLNPSNAILEEFCLVASPILKQLKILALSNRSLSEARDLLLPRLMSGEVAV